MVEAIRLSLAELDIEARLPVKRLAIQEGWYEFDCLMGVAIVLEIGIAIAIWSFRRLHGI